ncbi:hypothetical protein ADN01_14685 [Levilinea saccharolytica]|uniref:Pyrrolo-quinoline quinone repeat domain-containing protein n=2 Tax=Levilinea saccharolytica TaxID=229921 RepID=A0A0P6XE08_9CHLR|nr:hypothetical protein ADN01_14685 [Levilinea saccharolytica]GAP18525.1 protein containing PQQ-like domain [Levilinea saccharolytica]
MILFCPECSEYLDPRQAECTCGWRRAQNALMQPGQPQWLSHLNGAAQGCALRRGGNIYVSWAARISGGVSALHAETGQPVWEKPLPFTAGVRSSPVSDGASLYAASSGLAHLGAELKAADLRSGSLRWQIGLPDSVLGTPLLAGENRLFTACENGQVLGVDTLRGQIIPAWCVSAPRGARWLARADSTLAVLNREGECTLFAFNHGSILPQSSLSLDAALNAPPILRKGHWLCPLADGRLVTVSLHHARLEKTYSLGASITAAPLPLTDGSCLLALADHTLRRVDLSSGHEIWRSPQMPRRVTGGIAVGMGLAVCAGHDGGLHALDLSNGDEVWSSVLPSGSPLISDVLFAEGVFYAGSKEGEFFAVPWHGGRYDWAARFLAADRQQEKAGEYSILAAVTAASPRERREYFHSALSYWQAGERYEWSARLRERLPNQNACDLAQEFQRAGENYALAGHPSQELMVRMYLRASDWYEESCDQAQADRCRAEAQRLGRAPYLTFSKVNLPENCDSDRSYTAVFEVVNRGNSAAHNVLFRIAGNLQVRIHLQAERLPVGVPVEIEAPLYPLTSGDLVVHASYVDSEGRRWHNQKVFPWNVKPYDGVEIFGHVGLLKDIIGRVRVHGDVGAVSHVKALPADRDEVPDAHP